MKAAVLHGAGDIRIEERPRPQPAPGRVLVEVAACGICNSDVQRVRAAAVPRLPLVLGHEFAGRVAECGEGVRDLAGRRVAVYPLLWCGRCAACARNVHECCAAYSYHGSREDGGFAEFVLTRPENLVPLPDDVTGEEGAMTEPAAVGLHALNRAEFRAGESVAIIGAGAIGLIVAQIARARGAAKVILCDAADAALESARGLGFDLTVRTDAGSVAETVATARGMAGGDGPHVVLEAAGALATYNLALELAPALGRVVLMGNISGDLTVPRERVSSILRKQLRVLGTWNSSLVGSENEWAAVHGMVARKEIDLASLISHRVTLDKLADAFRMMIERREPYRKIMVLCKGEGR